MDFRWGNKVLRQTQDDAATVGSSLTNRPTSGRVQNSPSAAPRRGLGETSNGDGGVDVRPGDGFILFAHLG
jgi:hypothetical protein